MLRAPRLGLQLPPSLCLPLLHSTIPLRSYRASVEDQTGRVFVAGASGNTGKRIVKELLARGFKVRAGVRDLAAASKVLPADLNIEMVQADVTEGADKLAKAIGNVETVVCATGFRRSLDFFAPWKVDNFGTVSLVDACKKNRIKRFVLISSILVNGAAMGQVLNPAYIVLNVLGLTLIAKLQAEKYIRQSGINYTIVRPGGLTDSPPSGNIVMAPEDTLYEGSISRDSVASIAVEALLHPEASNKVVEIVSRSNAPKKSAKELFAAVK